MFLPYRQSSFLSAHAGFRERATLERSVRGAVLIGCSKTMQVTGSNSETQYGGQKRQEDFLLNVFESKYPVDLCGPRATQGSVLLQLERFTGFQCNHDKR